MSKWSGKWQLTEAALGYGDLFLAGKTNKFSLKAKRGTAGAYTVVPSGASMAPAWNGCVLQACSGASGPELPWPLPKKPTKIQMRKAGEILTPIVTQAWRTANKYERLEGKVLIQGVQKDVAVFKVEKGLTGGKAFLVAFLNVDLDGRAGPGGSLVGTKIT